MDMEQFFTRETANEGVKLPLFLPNGQETNEWLLVRGVDSDQFRLAQTKAARQALTSATIEDEHEREEFRKKVENEAIASLIADWSFSQPCTHENVVKLFVEAPQIRDAVNTYAARRAEFYEKKLERLSAGSGAK